MKRVFLLFLIFAICFCCVPTFAQTLPEAVYDDPPAQLICGDTNRDNTADIIDAMLTLRIAQNLITLPDDLSYVCADSNHDYSITTVDALILLRKVMFETTPHTCRRIAFLNSLFDQMGKPYVYGDSGPDSFDCSGLVYYCLNQSGYSISRQSSAMYAANENWDYISSINDLVPGDLMFFRQDDESRITHVGVYIGNNLILHASSGAGRIVISSMTNWYLTNFRWGRRVDF